MGEPSPPTLDSKMRTTKEGGNARPFFRAPEPEISTVGCAREGGGLGRRGRIAEPGLPDPQVSLAARPLGEV